MARAAFTRPGTPSPSQRAARGGLAKMALFPIGTARCGEEVQCVHVDFSEPRRAPPGSTSQDLPALAQSGGHSVKLVLDCNFFWGRRGGGARRPRENGTFSYRNCSLEGGSAMCPCRLFGAQARTAWVHVPRPAGLGPGWRTLVELVLDCSFLEGAAARPGVMYSEAKGHLLVPLVNQQRDTLTERSRLVN